MYNWSDYIAEDTVPNFEKEFGVKVTYDTYESNEEMVAKLQAGATGYDIIVPSRLHHSGAGGHRSHHPSTRSTSPTGGTSRRSSRTCRPTPGHTHGALAVGHHRHRLPDRQGKSPVDSWAVFHDPKLRGKMTMMDDGREVIGAFLRYRGHSLNSTDPQQLAQAKADSSRQEAAQGLPLGAGQGAAHLGRRLDLAALERRYHPGQGGAAQPRLRHPQGGLHHLGRLDVPPKSAPNKRAAHEWMNYILRPEVGAALSDATGYGTPNAAAPS